MKNDLPTTKDLISTGMMAPQNRYMFIAMRVIYLLFHPQKWISWIKTFYIDIRYSHAYLGGRINNGSLSTGRTGSSSSSYHDLATMFSGLTIKEDDVIVDVGCGKGRVLNFFLSKKYTVPLIGVEVDPIVGALAKTRFERYSQIKIIIGAIEHASVLPKTGTIFYLSNPFFDSVMEKFSKLLEEKIKNGEYKNNERPLIIYYHCYQLQIFEKNPFWVVKKLDNVFAAIISPAITNHIKTND